MTSTVPQRVFRGLRLGQVYAYLTLNHEDRSVIEFAYAGQTRQPHRGRDSQHRDSQPWSDLIVGDPIILAEGYWTDRELDGIEQAAITGDWRRFAELAATEIRRRAGRPDAVPDLSGVRAVTSVGLRPRYNVEHNLDNPDRIPPWTAQEQRRARDEARFGRQVWVPSAPLPSVVPAGWWPPPVWQLWLLAWLPLWLWLGVWLSSLWLGGGLSALLLGWGVWHGRRDRRRRRPGRVRRPRRRGRR